MKKKISKSLLMTALVTGLCIGGVQDTFAAGNLDTFALDEYVVTATRTMKQLQEVPASVSVVTAKDIEERNISTVPDALQNLPGVYVGQSASYGPTGNLTVRGYSSDNILVLVDGAPVNNAYNNDVDWEMLPVENIERIELVKGAGSSLYGGRAVGAVINIISKEATDKKVSGSAVLSYGSNSTWKKSINANINVNEKFSFGIGYENKKSDGYRTNNNTASAGKIADLESGTSVLNPDKEIPQLSNGKYVLGGRGNKKWENEHITTNLKYNFDDSKSVRYTYTHNETEYSYDTPWTTVFVNGKATYKGYVGVGNDKYVSLGSTIGSGYLGYDGKKESDLHTLNYKDEDNKFIINFSYLDITRNGYSSPASASTIPWSGAGKDSYYPGETFNFDVQKAWENIGKHTIVVGGNYRQESFDQIVTRLTNWRDHNSINSSYGKNGMTAEHGGKAKSMALFVQDEYKISEPVTMYLGMRYDRYEKCDGYGRGYDTKTGELKDSNDYGNETFGEISPKLAFDFKANDTTDYYVSYGHSFNPPPLYQVYRNDVSDNSVRANPGIEPETSDTFEIGVKKRLSEKTMVAANMYYIETDDKIVYATYYKPNTTDKDYTIYENWGEEKRRGVEFEIEHNFDENWGAYLNYAWQHGKTKKPNVTGSSIKASNSTDYSVPKHLLHAGLNYKNGKFNGIIECQYVSERQKPDAITGEYGSEDAFFIVNTALNYDIAPNTTLQFGINNIFDRDFYCSTMTPGRTYYAGLRYSF